MAKNKRFNKLLALLLISFALLVRFWWFFSFEKPIQLPRNEHVVLKATLKKEPRFFEKSQVLAVGDLKVYVPIYPKYRVGDVLIVEGTADGEGRMFQAKVDKFCCAKSKVLGQLRQEIASKIKTYLPQREATLVLGTVLGVDDIAPSFREALIKTGTIHVVVVSGQNLAYVAGFFLYSFKFLGRRKPMVIACIGCLFYAALTGFAPPVVRATIMVLAVTLAKFVGREIVPIWGLFLAALLILFFSPGSFFEISFQLTFAATLGIITLGEALQRVSRVARVAQVSRVARAILKSVIPTAAVAISAYVFTAPIIFLYFERVSPIAPLVNILVGFSVAPIMVLGFATAILSLVFPPLAQLVAYFAYVPAFYFVKVVELFAT